MAAMDVGAPAKVTTMLDGNDWIIPLRSMIKRGVIEVLAAKEHRCHDSDSFGARKSRCVQ